MKIIVAGGGDSGVELVKTLIREKHEVVLIEFNRERVDELAEKLDCLVIHGDSTDPNVLKEAGIEEAELFIALTGSDRDNILSALIARSLGASNIIVKINNPVYNDLLISSGIENIINPSRLIVDQIIAMIKGLDLSNITVFSKSGIKFYVFEIPDNMVGKKISEIEINDDRARIMLIYRGEEALFPRPDTILDKGDQVLIGVKSSGIDKILKIFGIK